MQRPLRANMAVALCLLLGSAAPGAEAEPALPSLRVGMVWDANTEASFKESGAPPFAANYARARFHAFDIKGELERDLNRGVMPDELRDAFNRSAAEIPDRNVQLSENVTVETAGKGPVWLVIDRGNRRSLYVEKGKGHAARKNGMLSVYFDSPFASVSYWTLPNGLSVMLHTDRLRETDPRRVTGLAFANSTILFACKGESWYPARGVELEGDRCRLVGLAARPFGPGEGDKVDPSPVYLWKGMPGATAEEALKSAKLKALPMPAAWVERFPKSGRWLRYSLEGDTELAVNVDSGRDGRSPIVRWIVIEATKPASPDNDPGRYRIECELVDLKRPLEDNWHWAFHQAWSWDPSDPDRMRRLRSAGQRRWTKDQLPKDERSREPSHAPESAVGPDSNRKASPPTR